MDLEAVLIAPHDKSSKEDGLGAVKRTSRCKDGLGRGEYREDAIRLI